MRRVGTWSYHRETVYGWESGDKVTAEQGWLEKGCSRRRTSRFKEAQQNARLSMGGQDLSRGGDDDSASP